MLRRFLILALFASLVTPFQGCDRPSSQNPHPSHDGGSGPVRKSVQVSLITPLLPRLRTNLAVDSRGNLYWVQESDPPIEGGDLMFVLGNSGVPQSIPALSGRRLLESIGESEARNAKGVVRSMVVGPRDELYVLITGGTRHVPICAIGRYTPADGKVRIMADTRQIAAASGMGASIDLARGTLLSQGQDLWLWLRHSDAAVILRLIPTPAGSSVELHPLDLKPASRNLILQMNDEEEDLSAAPGQTLLYIDRRRSVLWKIQANGQYAPLQSLEGFSSALAAPASDAAGHICLIAGDAAPLTATAALPTGILSRDAESPAAWTQLAYPALVQMEFDEANKPTLLTLKRDDFTAPAALPLQDLQPRQLLLDGTNGTLISFDAASGELLRLKLAGK